MRIAYCINCGKKCKNDEYTCSKKCNKEWENKDAKCHNCGKKLTKYNKLNDEPVHIMCRYNEFKNDRGRCIDNIKSYSKALKTEKKEKKTYNKEIKEMMKKYKNELIIEAI